MEGDGYLCAARRRAVNKPVGDETVNPTYVRWQLALPQQVWSKLNPAWALFLLRGLAANIYIAFWLPQKYLGQLASFGLTALTLIFYPAERRL